MLAVTFDAHQSTIMKEQVFIEVGDRLVPPAHKAGRYVISLCLNVSESQFEWEDADGRMGTTPFAKFRMMLAQGWNLVKRIGSVRVTDNNAMMQDYVEAMRLYRLTREVWAEFENDLQRLSDTNIAKMNPNVIEKRRDDYAMQMQMAAKMITKLEPQLESLLTLNLDLPVKN